MALISRLPIADAALAAARALERLLGHDVMLTVGEPLVADLTTTPLPEGSTRAVALPFGADIPGDVTLIATEQLATSIEAATADASLVDGALPALAAATDVMEAALPLQASTAHAGEIATDTLTGVGGDFVTVPLFENDAYVAAIVIRVVDDGHFDDVATSDSAAAAAAAFEPPAPIAIAPEYASVGAGGAAGASAGPGTVAAYQFQMLGDGNGAAGPVRPLPLLNDVQMELTAELGRQRMKVRDLVALEPGSVIQLDRAAGSPVDVLVNGALIAHGEVVVIDEEFGIRVAEIVVGDSG
jgi:flagellar motor switch protein FliN/FliY